MQHVGNLGMTRRKPKVPTVALPHWALEPVTDPRLDDDRGITPEREARSGGASQWGRDERKRNTVRTMRDAPLEAMADRKQLTRHQYDAASKYRLHWYQAGLAGSLQSVDANRVFASDVTSFSGMAKTEAQAFHRQQYRTAVALIDIIPAAILETIVCYEKPLSEVGVTLGWKSKPKGIDAAEDILRAALDKLCRHWGIG